MSDCISTQEFSENSAVDTNADDEIEAEESVFVNKAVSEECGEPDNISSSEHVDPAKIADDDRGSLLTTDEDGDGPASPPADEEVHSSSQVEAANNPNSPESGEVSEEERASGICSPSKNLESVQSATIDDPENQDEFFDDDRSQTPLQDEPDTELVLKTTDLLKTDDASLEFTPVAVQLNDVHSQHTDQNTDGELSDDEKMSQEIADDDVQNVPEAGKAVTVERKDSVERKPTDADEYGELDYEEEEADDSLDKVKAGEERRKKDKPTNKDLTNKKELPNQEEVEDGEEPDEVKEVVKPTDCKEEKKLEPGEVPEEGEEPEEGEHSTDGELDDDDDCEEGEIREPGSKHAFVRPMCRFYTRGNCTWGANCRFLHPGINDKGNYAMIDPPYPGHSGMMGPGGPGSRVPPPPPGLPGPWIHDRLGKRVMPRRPPELDAEIPVAAPLPAPPTVAEAATESAWERGLRHAKEIRKMAKRKETDPALEGKKDSEPEEDKAEPVPAPLPPPQISGPLPPPRDPYYDDLPVRYEDDGFYARPPIPLPPPDAWPFRPPPMDPFEMRWPRGPMDFPPLPPPEFRLSERERALRERRFSPPPRFEPGRPPEDRFGRYNRYEPRYYRGGPRDPLPPPPTDVPVRGRGEEWKDPWLRSHSPKRKRASSSHSGSRGRRRSRSRSKGSYSSFSSSSYSSKSRSHSRSSSYSSSYSKSSRSRSYSSSRSSSRSRSRSKSPKKPLPVTTTLGQSILEKHGKAGDGPRSVINKVLPSAIGSVPLPPEKNLASSVAPSIKAIPPPPTATTAGSRPPVALESDSIKSPPQAPQPPVKQLVPGAPVPFGAKPIVVPGRPAALQPVGRGVAAAFSDKDDEHYDAPNSGRLPLPPPSSLMTSEKVPPHLMVDRSKGQLPLSMERSLDKASGLGPDRGASARLLPPPEVDRGRSRDRTSVAAPKVSSLPRQPSSGDKPLARASQPPSGKDIPKASQSGERGQARNQAPDGDRPSMRVTSNVDRVPVKPMLPVSDRSRAGRGSSSQMAMQPGGKSGPKPGEGFGNRGGTDIRGGPVPPDRSKGDPAGKRRERMRSSSTESSRSSSGSMSRSSSSGSRDSEHLYSDIASPISSASSISPVRSPPAKPRQGEKGRVPMNKNPSGRLLPPPPLSSSQHISQRSEGFRGELRDRAPPSSSRPPQPLSSHLPSRGGGNRDLSREGSGRELGGRDPSGRELGVGREPSGRELGGREPSGREPGGREPGGRELGGRELGGREPGGRELGGRELGGREPGVRELAGREFGGREFGGRELSGREPTGREPSGREISARSRDAVGVGHPRDMGGMSDVRLRSSSSSAHAQQSRQPSDRNPGLHSSQKGNMKQAVKPERPNSQLPPPPAPNSRKRIASPLGRQSPPNKIARRGPEQKEPVKITIPRHEKIVKPGSPPRRRSDFGHFPMTSPSSKAPPSKTTPSKAPSGAHAGGSSTSKRKAVSRREELLLQLQAVEDAIAKKRSKMQ